MTPDGARLSPPGLVIFDCDGVLVDTEVLANRRMAQWLAEAGVPVTYADCRRLFVGLSMARTVARVKQQFGIDLGDDFVRRWQDGLPSLFAGGVEAIPGVEDVLTRLHRAQVPCCVASSGSLAKMQLTLGSSGLLPHVADVLFSASMVQNGKPAPDLFLHAASRMGVEPAACVVIEDSPFGAAGARAAGMACYGYVGDPDTDAGGLAREGAVLFSSMAELPGLLGLDNLAAQH